MRLKHFLGGVRESIDPLYAKSVMRFRIKKWSSKLQLTFNQIVIPRGRQISLSSSLIITGDAIENEVIISFVKVPDKCLNLPLYKKWSFPLRISSVDVTKNAYKTSFIVQCLWAGRVFWMSESPWAGGSGRDR